MESQPTRRITPKLRSSRTLVAGLVSILGGCATIYEVPDPAPKDNYVTICTDKISSEFIDLFSYAKDSKNYRFIDKREFTNEQGQSCLEYHFQKI